MQPKKATVAVIGAGDFIGGAIAKRFAAEGFTTFVGRRNGEKLTPLLREIETAGGRALGRSLDARQEADITAFLREADPRGAARGLHLQRRGENQLPFARHHGTRVSQSVGDGLLFRLPRRPGGGAADAAERPGRDLFHRRDRELARWSWLRRRSRRPSSVCARWRKVRRANSGRRTFMWRTW